MHGVDVVIVGAGAAGLHCAALAGQRGLSVLLIDHAERVAEKIRISGGGRCNFTNRHVSAANFLSANPDFCRSALSRHPPADFIELVQRHGIGFHEKHKGQLFCDHSSQQIIDLLLAECAQAGVQRWQPCPVSAVRLAPPAATAPPGSAAGGQPSQTVFELDTPRGRVRAAQLVVATGGLSIPAIGASDWGHRLAHQFGHGVVQPRPALVPLTFEASAWAPFAALAGVSLPVRIGTVPGRGAPPGGAPDATEATAATVANTATAATAATAAIARPRRAKASAALLFDEDLLFTHRGLSGPGVLQVSSGWQPGEPLQINLAPGVALAPALLQAKAASRRQLGNVLAQWLPQRLADAWLARLGQDGSRPVANCKDRDLQLLADAVTDWRIHPQGTEGWRKAEATIGGVDTRELDSRNLQSRRQPGLYFIGEVVDVTGWLGGYNFQWAWSSAAACALALQPASSTPA